MKRLLALAAIASFALGACRGSFEQECDADEGAVRLG